MSVLCRIYNLLLGLTNSNYPFHCSSSHQSIEESKGPQCLEIAIPVIQGMQDDTVEPVQNFFEQQHFDAWHFDVFELHRITNNHSLWFIAMILFEHYKVIDIFQINTAYLRYDIE